MKKENDKRISVTHVIEATSGGTRRHVTDLVLGLDSARFDVSVICATGREPEFQHDITRMREDGHRVEVVDMVRNIRPPRDLAAGLRIRRLLQDVRPDIVHTHSAKAGMLGRFAARSVGVPSVIHTPHVFPFEMTVAPPTRHFYKALERMAARRCQRIVCVCPAERETALKHRIAPPEKLAVIENGVAHGVEPGAAERLAARTEARREMGIPEDALAVGLVGRFTPQKGQDFLLQAAAELHHKLPHAVYAMVGGGELGVQLTRLAGQLGVSDQCRFLEHRENIQPLYAAFDLMTMPSRWEGLPYALLEGMAAGLPVVAFDSGGIRDALVNGDNGLLVPRGDVEALAQAVLELGRAPERRRILGAAAKATVRQRFQLQQMIDDTARLYEELCMWT